MAQKLRSRRLRPRPFLMARMNSVMAWMKGSQKRRDIVGSSPNLSARELCQLFDDRQVPVPRRWKDAGIEWWTKAYQSRFRGRAQNLISRDRTG